MGGPRIFRPRCSATAAGPGASVRAAAAGVDHARRGSAAVEASSPASRRRRVLRWAAVAAWTSLIYLTLPAAPLVWRGFLAATGGVGRHLAAFGVAAVALIAVAVVRRLRPPAGRVLGLIGVAFAYVAALTLIPLTAGERTHLLSYGVLAWLVLRALELDLDRGVSAVAAVVLVSALGLGDELIQGALPNRVFEWKDVLLNSLSGVLATTALMLTVPRNSGTS